MKNLILENNINKSNYIDKKFMDNIKCKKGNTTVLIDLFFKNGFAFNRYIMLYFDENKNCKSFIINPREVLEKIKQEVNRYLKKIVDYYIKVRLVKKKKKLF